MKDYACTRERFLNNIARHTMTVLRDEGVYRHLRFRETNTGCFWFDLITYPGTLVIDGDMGTYVFRRTEDMFEFFRTDNEYARSKGDEFGINPGYWGEKLRSVDVDGGYKEFDPEIFARIVKTQFDEWVEAEGPSEEAKTEVWEGIETEVLWGVEEGGPEKSIEAAMEFRNEDHDFEFVDFWDNNFKSFTYCFIWCCYAIAWGVNLYDKRGDE